MLENAPRDQSWRRVLFRRYRCTIEGKTRKVTDDESLRLAVRSGGNFT